MTRLIAMRGFPGSGKTTFARKWVAEDRAKRARVNRDDIRKMLDGGVHVIGVTEIRAIIIRDASILELLKRGFSVVCDDTNLSGNHVRALQDLARIAGVDFWVEDLRNVPLKTCLERNAARTDKAPVPEEDIRRMHALFVNPHNHQEPCA